MFLIFDSCEIPHLVIFFVSEGDHNNEIIGLFHSFLLLTFISASRYSFRFILFPYIFHFLLQLAQYLQQFPIVAVMLACYENRRPPDMNTYDGDTDARWRW